VDQAEGGGREQLAFLALARRAFDQVGRVPFAEKNLEPLQLQPAFEQIDLRRFARAVETFHRNQTAGKIQFRKSSHCVWKETKYSVS
jgi:hypothetical protein